MQDGRMRPLHAGRIGPRHGQTSPPRVRFYVVAASNPLRPSPSGLGTRIAFTASGSSLTQSLAAYRFSLKRCGCMTLSPEMENLPSLS